MDSYCIKEQEKYEKERRNEGSTMFLLVTLGAMATMVPVMLAVAGAHKIIKVAKGVLKHE